MSAVPKQLLTAQEYLAIERKAVTRSEFYRGEMLAMDLPSFEHNLITGNLSREAGYELKDAPCRILTSDMRIKVVATAFYTYPDGLIVCGEPEFEDAERDTLLNPRVLVEVFSDSTESYDRGGRFQQYRRIPSLQEYVVVAQNEVLVERWVRQANDSWRLTEFPDPAGTFEFASVPVRVPLAEIYRGVEFPDDSQR